MAEGTDPLFTNWRTGEQLNLAAALFISGTASLASGLAPVLPSVIVSANTASLASALGPVLPTALTISSTVSLASVFNGNVIVSNATISGNSTVVTIPEWVRTIDFFIFTLSSDRASDYPKIQLSTDGVVFATAGSYFSQAYNVAVPVYQAATDGIVSMFTSSGGITAGASFNMFGSISGIDAGSHAMSTFIGSDSNAVTNFVAGFGFFFKGTRVRAIRIITSTATSSFDSGTITVTGRP